MTILREQTAAVLDRRADYDEAEAYYEGLVPETFSTHKLRRAFRTTGETTTLNFCRPVVDAVANRLQIAAIAGSDDAATQRLIQIWEDNEMDLYASEIHRRAAEYGDCYAVVWPDAAGNIQIAYNSPKEMALVYDPENPRKKSYAVKMWRQDKKTTRMNIYTESKIVKYDARGDISEGTNWRLIGIEDNPFGEIPVFHFRTHRPFGHPEHKEAYDAQNMINKLVITNMFTIDYQGAPQRYALSAMGAGSEVDDFDDGKSTKDNLDSLRNGPGELWYLQGVSQVGEFSPAQPEVFWNPIKDTIRVLATLTHTPQHYFLPAGNVPSGEALRVAEAPLSKKVADRKRSFGATWKELLEFVLLLEGMSGSVSVKWLDVESMDSLSEWDVMLKKINAGLSYHQALRERGYSDTEIARIMTERQEEAANGLYYQRAPQARVSTTNNETQMIQGN